MMAPDGSRPRVLYLALCLAVIAAGLFTRSESPLLPEFVQLYFGDALWAVMFFPLFAFLFPAVSTWRLAAITAVFVFGLEFLQLANWPWLVELRRVSVARYLLGTTFLWSDVIGLGVGVVLAALLDNLFVQGRRPPMS